MGYTTNKTVPISQSLHAKISLNQHHPCVPLRFKDMHDGGGVTYPVETLPLTHRLIFFFNN